MTQLGNELNHLEKNEIDLDILRKDHKEFIKNNKLILKLHQIFRSKKTKFLLKKLTRLH